MCAMRRQPRSIRWRGGEAADGLIVGADIGCVRVGEAAVDQDVGHAAGFDAFEDVERRGRLRGGEQQAIDLARQQALDFARFEAPSSSELQITTS